MHDAISAAKNAAHYIQDRCAASLGKRRIPQAASLCPLGII
jgi:hypothetical protein